MLEPGPLHHWRFDENTVTVTAKAHGLSSDTLTYTGSGVGWHKVGDGPCQEISHAYGRGGGQPNPDVWKIDYTGTSDPPYAIGTLPTSTGPTDDQNPSGLVDETFTMSCWFRINDLATVWARDNSDDDDGTECCLMSVGHYVLGGGTMSPSGWNARMSVKRTTASAPGPAGAYYHLEGHLEDPDAGTSISAVARDDIHATYAFLLNDTDWHLLSVRFTENSITTLIDGVQVYYKTGTTISIPGTPRTRVAVNYNTGYDGGTTITGCRDCQIAYASLQNEKIEVEDLRRHYSSMKRWFDHKVTDYHSTEPLASGSVHERSTAYADHVQQGRTDSKYSVACLKAQHRHDGRYANVIRLDNPFYSNTETDYDDDTGTIYIPQTRLVVSGPVAGAQGDMDENFFRYEKDRIQINTCGAAVYQEVAAAANNLSIIPGKVAVITGYDGHKHHPGPGISNYREFSFIFNFGINADDGDSGHAMHLHGDYAQPTGGNTVSLIRGGWALWRDGNKFYFWAPYGISGDPAQASDYIDEYMGNVSSQAPESHYSTGSVVVDNRYQAIAFTCDHNDGILGMVEQPHVYPNGSDKVIEYLNTTSTGSGSPPVGFGDYGSTFINTWPACEEAAPVRSMFVALKCTTSMWTGIPYDDAGALGGQGDDDDAVVDNRYFATDRNRYGPTAICSKRIDEPNMRRIMRIMHGQRLHRTRPALRGCNRHFAFTAPSRILT